MAGHSRPKDGVASLVYVPAIPFQKMPEQFKRQTLSVTLRWPRSGPRRVPVEALRHASFEARAARGRLRMTEYMASLMQGPALDNGPSFRYIERISLGQGRLSRRYSGSRSEVGARGRKDTVRPRAARASCLPALRPAREVLTGLGQAPAGNARQTTSQEAWLEPRLG
jgi:hypothetical protein